MNFPSNEKHCKVSFAVITVIKVCYAVSGIVISILWQTPHRKIKLWETKKTEYNLHVY